MKTVLWIDDAADQRDVGARMLKSIGGVAAELAASSDEAKRILKSRPVDAVVTDLLRRNSDRSVSKDDGYAFFRDFIRPGFPTLPVIFHTKNLPSSFETDEHSQYLSKWDVVGMTEIELETRLADVVRL
jgi:CheY-like chemotaxis protein